MPVTARLSKAFYDRFGDAIVSELVDWFNQVDATYRSDLRELNEVNFARSDAKLEQRVAELRGEFREQFAQLDAKLDRVIAELEARIDRRFLEQSRWYFAGWIVQVLMLLAIWRGGR